MSIEPAKPPEPPPALTPSGSFPAYQPMQTTYQLANVAEKSWVLTTLGTVIVVVAGAFVFVGTVVFGQAADAGRAGTVAAAAVDVKVEALTKVVAENQRLTAVEAAEVRSDIRALSLQMATGFQAPRLRVAPDGGSTP